MKMKPMLCDETEAKNPGASFAADRMRSQSLSDVTKNACLHAWCTGINMGFCIWLRQ